MGHVTEVPVVAGQRTCPEKSSPTAPGWLADDPALVGSPGECSAEQSVAAADAVGGHGLRCRRVE
jgi:hypothetical protein